jgi:hypothetical protein
MEMKGKLKITRQLQRMAALPYNYFLRDMLVRIRNSYSIPKESEQAYEWFSEYIVAYFGKGFTKGIVNPMELVIQHTPLGEELKSVASQFGLPGICVRNLLLYLLDSDQNSLLIFDRPVVNIERSAEGGMPTLDVTLLRITPWMNRKDWDNIWLNQVRIKVDELKTNNPEHKDFAKKRSTIHAYEEQMKRYAEWYELVELKGLPIGKALREWEGSHPNEVTPEGIDESTVSKAVKEFREIITPKD